MQNANDEKNVKSQIEGMKRLIELSEKSTAFSAGRSYMNAERTLSVWIRTALAAMIFGIAINRLDILFFKMNLHVEKLANIETFTKMIGFGLVFFSLFIAISSGIRFIAYVKNYKKDYPLPSHYNPWLPTSYAFLTVLFSIFLLILMFSVDKII